MKRKFFLKRFAVYFFAFFIPTFLLFVIAMVVFGRNAEQRLISQEQKVLESTDTNLSLVVNNIAMQNDLFTKNPYMGFALKNILKKSDYISYECFILGKHTARNGVAGISPPRREFQKC